MVGGRGVEKIGVERVSYLGYLHGYGVWHSGIYIYVGTNDLYRRVA